jgi:hypothetical protein
MSFTAQTYTDFGVALTGLETRIQAAFAALPSGGADVRHVRFACPALSASANTDVTVTLPTAFADTNFTAVATLEDSTVGDAPVVRKVVSRTPSTVVVRVGTGSVGYAAGQMHLNVVAVHD